ncbi:hypothetical protein IRT45_24295 [Nocardia sp. BSTN01]|uniref:hypothetical protein n=1 Tax=Nocardia sp. BSTN01 TaxID=2783665 RepID=UPI00188F83F4|nr:hypothetical protein [Nocardia sp. BSTN01]MBF5000270.1 hypothetical protein [Nocardia sp. BSTN01]
MFDRLTAGSSLTTLPLLGGPIGVLDDFLLDLEFSEFWAATVEFVIAAIVLFGILTVVVGILIPRLSNRLCKRTDLVAAAASTVLLAPEWLITRLLIKSGRRPGRIVYTYGYGVLALADGLRIVVDAALRRLAGVGKYRHWVAGLLLVVGLLSWNSVSCAGDSKPCISPARQWVLLIQQPDVHADR